MRNARISSAHFPANGRSTVPFTEPAASEGRGNLQRHALVRVGHGRLNLDRVEGRAVLRDPDGHLVRPGERGRNSHVERQALVFERLLEARGRDGRRGAAVPARARRGAVDRAGRGVDEHRSDEQDDDRDRHLDDDRVAQLTDVFGIGLGPHRARTGRDQMALRPEIHDVATHARGRDDQDDEADLREQQPAVRRVEHRVEAVGLAQRLQQSRNPR